VNVGAVVVVVAGAVGNPNEPKGAAVVFGFVAPKENVGAAVLVGTPNPVKVGLVTVAAAAVVDAGVPKPNAGAAVGAGVEKLNGVAVVVVVAPNRGAVDADVLACGAPNVNGLAVGAVVVVVPGVVPNNDGLVVVFEPNVNAI